MADPDKLVQEANNRLNKFSLTNLFDKTIKYETAIPLYERAGNLYKMSKRFDEAGDVFLKAADCSMKLESEYDIANYYINAYQCYKKTNMVKAIEYINKAINIYNDQCNYIQVVRYKKDLAECYEYNGDYANALECYLMCMNILQIEDNSASLYLVQSKIAELYIKLKKYTDAADMYVKLVENIIENNSLKFRANEYLMNALICTLAENDIVKARKTMDKFCETNNFFVSTEFKLISEIMVAIETNDIERYTYSIKEYDNLKKLNNWQVNILLNIQKEMDAAGLA